MVGRLINRREDALDQSCTRLGIESKSRLQTKVSVAWRRISEIYGTGYNACQDQKEDYDFNIQVSCKAVSVILKYEPFGAVRDAPCFGQRNQNSTSSFYWSQSHN